MANNKKKVFDIVPPEPPAAFPSPEPKRQIERKTIRKPILIGVTLVFIGVLSFVFIEPKAEIEIWPEQEVLDFKTQLVVGEILRVEKSASQELSSTGTKLKTAKAHGIIRVYNDYSTRVQPLVATTRFVSDGGKLFRTPQRVNIPGAYYEGGKLVPGSLDIEVVADQPGEEYNIGPATFSIPGFAGTAKYTAFYARSFEPMTGGMKYEVPQVTQEDLDQAQNILTKQALEDCQTSLENSIASEEYIIVEGAITHEVGEITPLAEKGQELTNFLFQVTALAKAVVFKKSDLEEFAQSYIRTQLPQEKELQESSLDISYFTQSVDLEKGKITLDLEISAKIYSTINEHSLKEIIKSKKPAEIRRILKNFPEINNAQAYLWPFWVTKAPQDTERIKIKLNLD